MLRFAQLPIGEGDGSVCSRCHPGGTDSFFSVERIAHDVEQTIESWPDGNGANVAFIGPEPFRHPSLPQVVASATQCGAARVRLRTDGGALSVAGNAAGVLGAGVSQIEVVVLGADASMHDKLSDRAGLFEAARTGVRAFLDAASTAGVPVAVTVLVRLCKHNGAHLPAIAAEVSTWGISCIDVETVAGVRVPDNVAADALQIAMMNGVWLRGASDSVVGVEPWIAQEESQ